MNLSVQYEHCTNTSDLINLSFRDKNPWVHKYLAPTLEALIIATNALVVISSGMILKKGHQPRSTYLFLGNIAMADLIMGLSFALYQIMPKEYTDHNICAIQIGMAFSSAITSAYSIGLIGIDRFLYILHGMHYQRWVYPTRARFSICITWMIGLIIGFLPLMGWYGDTDNGRNCRYIILTPSRLVLLTAVTTAIPLIIVLFLYSLILYQATKKINELKRAENSNRETYTRQNCPSGNIRMIRGGSSKSELQNGEPQQGRKGIMKLFKGKPSASPNTPNKFKAIKVVLFTTGGFLITWFPYIVVCVIYVYNCDDRNCSTKCRFIRYLITVPFALLLFVNCLLNPIIYAWWHKGFRRFVRKTVHTVKNRKNTNEGINSASTSKTITTRSASVDNGINNEAYISDINLS